jgi:tRNA (guanine26-N2/guanine27-N2)-dimethyltransferase
MKYGAKSGDEALKNMGHILHCFKCSHREGAEGLFAATLPERCSECGSKLSVGGPLWLGELSNLAFLKLMAGEAERKKLRFGGKIGGMLSLMRAEVSTSIPYYVVDKLCDSLNLPVPSVKKVIETLREQGFQASLTHFNPRGIRSDAPASRIRRILCEFAR